MRDVHEATALGQNRRQLDGEPVRMRPKSGRRHVSGNSSRKKFEQSSAFGTLQT
jgi:hypothetical protein